MKTKISLFAGILFATMALIPQSSFAGDYFQDQVLKTGNKEMTREVLGDIKIRDVALKSSTEKLRLAQTKFFIAQTKKEIVNRYAEGTISTYEFEDIKNELSYLAFSMNQYFSNYRAYERSKDKEYQASAFQNLRDANQCYGRLKVATLKAARSYNLP
jgi:hypothetical protein